MATLRRLCWYLFSKHQTESVFHLHIKHLGKKSLGLILLRSSGSQRIFHLHSCQIQIILVGNGVMKLFQPVMTTILPALELTTESSTSSCKTGRRNGRCCCYKTSYLCFKICDALRDLVQNA